jgi:two-component system sensor histidine kinase KdpD
MVREKSRAAGRERRNLERLYDLAQRLTMIDPVPGGYRPLLETLLGVLELQAVCVFDGATARMEAVGESRLLRERTRDAYIRNEDVTEADAGMVLRCFRRGGRATAAIGLLGLKDPEGMAGPVVALATAATESGRTARGAASAHAKAYEEPLRTAILDALAHEFKSPLTAILTAVGGLREMGRLGQEETELADIVESEADRLDRLSSRLLRLARLDSEEIRPRLERASITPLVRRLLKRHARQALDREFGLSIPLEPPEIAVDPELFQLALSQLLDNACKYSPPGRPIEADVECCGPVVAVIVTSSGSSIDPAEQRMIFERFYRGQASRRDGNGNGLGLYVARKIALAHGGTLQLDPVRPRDKRVAFRLTVPAVPQEGELAESNPHCG